MKKIPKPMKSARSSKETTLSEDETKIIGLDKANNLIENIDYTITNRNWPKCNHYICDYMRLLVICNYTWTFCNYFLCWSYLQLHYN